MTACQLSIRNGNISLDHVFVNNVTIALLNASSAMRDLNVRTYAHFKTVTQ
jgi:hypothetical protein